MKKRYQFTAFNYSRFAKVHWSFSVVIFWGKKRKTRFWGFFFFSNKFSLTKFLISLLYACEQRDAADWKKKKKKKKKKTQKVAISVSNIAFSENRQFLQSVMLRPKNASVWTWTTRLYPTEQVVSILHAENVQNDTWFGICLMLCTIFKTCCQSSENEIFETTVNFYCF